MPGLLWHLARRNALRDPLRTLLTQLGMAAVICALGLLRTVVDAWYAGPDATAPTRLITRNAMSVLATLPVTYAQRLQAVDGVSEVTWRNWFGGTYRDPRNFFAQFAVDPTTHFAMFPELLLDDDQRLAFQADRTAAVVGAGLARDFGWKLGDVVALKGGLYPGDWTFTVRGIYRGLRADSNLRQMFIHWQRVSDAMQGPWPSLAGQAGMFIVSIRDPAEAAAVASRIDALFANSAAETVTETERAYKLGILSMGNTILAAIDGVSALVVLVVLALMCNTMAMASRERLAEYATLKALGFGPGAVCRLLFTESVLVALGGGVLGMVLTVPAVSVFGASLPWLPVFELTLGTAATQLLAALVVGVLAAVWPAWSLARVDIVTGLRHVA